MKLLVVLLLISLVESTDWYVSPFGNDQTGSGTLNNPYQTIARALTNFKTGVVGAIVLMEGVYAGPGNTGLILVVSGINITSLSGPKKNNCLKPKCTQISFCLQPEFEYLRNTYFDKRNYFCKLPLRCIHYRIIS